jgi:dolichol-phosphate mannosyltransferase
MIRAGRFTAVAVAGFVLQTAVLEGLTAAGLHYLPATLVAVEAAILHNYVWHERWTWRDRGTPPGSRAARLARYHGLTAAVSLGGQALTVMVLTGGLGLRPSISSALAVVALGGLTYAGAGRFVFPPPAATRPDGAGIPRPAAVRRRESSW